MPDTPDGGAGSAFAARRPGKMTGRMRRELTFFIVRRGGHGTPASLARLSAIAGGSPEKSGPGERAGLTPFPAPLPAPCGAACSVGGSIGVRVWRAGGAALRLRHQTTGALAESLVGQRCEQRIWLERFPMRWR